MTPYQIGLTMTVFLGLGFPALAQVDLSGSWASKNHEDALERGAARGELAFVTAAFGSCDPSSSFERPKSTTLTEPAPESIRFSGLMSR